MRWNHLRHGSCVRRPQVFTFAFCFLSVTLLSNSCIFLPLYSVVVFCCLFGSFIFLIIVLIVCETGAEVRAAIDELVGSAVTRERQLSKKSAAAAAAAAAASAKQKQAAAESEAVCCSGALQFVAVLFWLTCCMSPPHVVFASPLIDYSLLSSSSSSRPFRHTLHSAVPRPPPPQHCASVATAPLRALHPPRLRCRLQVLQQSSSSSSSGSRECGCCIGTCVADAWGRSHRSNNSGTRCSLLVNDGCVFDVVFCSLFFWFALVLFSFGCSVRSRVTTPMRDPLSPTYQNVHSNHSSTTANHSNPQQPQQQQQSIPQLQSVADGDMRRTDSEGP